MLPQYAPKNMQNTQNTTQVTTQVTTQEFPCEEKGKGGFKAVHYNPKVQIRIFTSEPAETTETVEPAEITETVEPAEITEPIKEYDGPTRMAILYTRLLYGFVTNTTSRKTQLLEELSKLSYDTLVQLRSVATLMYDKLADPTVNKVPLWGKGQVSKTGNASFTPRKDGGASLILMESFINVLTEGVEQMQGQS